LACSIFPHAAPYRIRHRLGQIGKNGAFASRDQDVGHHARLELFADFFGKLRPSNAASASGERQPLG
jgi:hypothetical protein